MFKALIVDDEQPVLDGLRVLINRHVDSIQVAGTARSGREALELARSIMPDLVFMDVKMPGISGLEAIKELKRFLPDSIYILVTAYERFDIAQEAFDLGVQDYLLKPVNRDKLLAVLNKSIRALEERLEERETSATRGEILEDCRLLLEPHLFRTARLRHGLGEAEYHERLRMVAGIHQLPFEGGRVMVLGGSGLGSRAGQFREAVRFKCRCVTAPDGPDRIQIFVPKPESQDLSRISGILKDLGEETLGGDEVSLGIGGDLAIWDIDQSLEQAQADFARPDEGEEIPYPWELEREAAEALVSGHADGFLAELGRLVDALVARSGTADHVAWVARQLEDLALVLVHTLRQREPKACHGLPDPHLDPCSGPGGLRDNFLAWASRLSGAWEQARPRKLSGVAEKAREFISLNFSKPVSLDDAAQYAGVSSQYLCRVFSDEMGESFIDALTRARIQKARELLREGIPIKVVSMELGYSDPNYFGRLFKRITGLTPKEYARG